MHPAGGPTARSALAVALVLALACGARAGGGSFGQDDDDNASDSGPPFFGFVKDKAGNGIDDAKITVTIKNLNSSMILRTDSQGHFFIKGFDKTIATDDIDVTCSKDGYKEVAHSRLPATDPTTPIEVDCVLEKQ